MKLLNKWINLLGDNFKPNVRLSQPGFTYSALLDHLLNIVEKSENSDAAYSDWKDLTKKTFI